MFFDFYLNLCYLLWISGCNLQVVFCLLFRWLGLSVIKNIYVKWKKKIKVGDKLMSFVSLGAWRVNTAATSSHNFHLFYTSQLWSSLLNVTFFRFFIFLVFTFSPFKSASVSAFLAFGSWNDWFYLCCKNSFVCV